MARGTFGDGTSGDTEISKPIHAREQINAGSSAELLGSAMKEYRQAGICAWHAFVVSDGPHAAPSIWPSPLGIVSVRQALRSKETKRLI